MKIVFVNRFFFPDHSATSQLLTDVTVHLAEAGYEVAVVTSRQTYDNPLALYPARANEQGVRVVRVWSTMFGRRHLPGRTLDYATFYASALWSLLALTKKDDVIVAKTDPPLISVLAAMVTRLRGALLVNWIQDLFPEVVSSLLGGRAGKFFWSLRSLRNWSLLSAKWNVVIGKQMQLRLEREGIPAENIQVIHNWADGQAIRPIDREHNELRREWKLQQHFVVGYSGNFGRAHDFQTILDTVQLLRNESHIVFVFIGGGAQHEWLRGALVQKGLTNVVFKPYQPRERLHLSLCVPDLHLISLQPSLEGLIVPSKFYGIAAAGRPTLYVGDTEGEVPRLLRESNCGFTVLLGQAETAANIIRSLASDMIRCAHYGQNARDLFDAQFDKTRAERAWRLILNNCADHRA